MIELTFASCARVQLQTLRTSESPLWSLPGFGPRLTPQVLQSLRDLKVQTCYLESWVISLVALLLRFPMRYTRWSPCFTPLKIRQFEMDTHGAFTVHRRAGPPHGVLGFDQLDARRVSAARPTLRGGVPSPYGRVAPGWETPNRPPVCRLQKLSPADAGRSVVLSPDLPENIQPP